MSEKGCSNAPLFRFLKKNMNMVHPIPKKSLLLWKIGIGMPGELSETLERVSNKARLLVERYNVLLNLKREADARVEELNATVLAQRKEIEYLKAQTEYLRLATTISPSRADLDKTRQTITLLVREIDRCISDLSE